MSAHHTVLPWAFLSDWKGKLFNGEWPTLPEMFRITAARFPDRPCFTDFDPEKITRTYGQALSNINNLAQWLAHNGVTKGVNVAVSGKNSSEWATVYLATLFAGGTIVPIDYGLQNHEIGNLLDTAKPLFFFVDEEKIAYFLEHPHGARIYSLSRKYPEQYVYNLKAEQMQETVSLAEASEEDTAAILFTSGTTGTPKGVMLTHRNLVSDCYIAQTNLTIYETDVFYALLPIHHAYTMLAVFIEAISVGAEIVFGKSMAVSRMLKELKEGKITMLLGVPLLFNKLLAGILRGIKEKGPVVDGIMKILRGLSFAIKRLTGCNPGKVLFASVLKKASISSVRIAICGGGPLAASVFRVYNELGIDFIQGYGLTETSPLVAGCGSSHRAQRPGFIGQVVLDDSVILLDKNTEGIGEIAVKGPNVMKGYYNKPELTAEVFTEDGYFRTGDLGYLDKKGRLAIRGRVKTMILGPGGENIYPEMIETLINNLDFVEESLVVPEDGGLLALIKIDISLMADKMKISVQEAQKEAEKYIASIRKNVNSQLSAFSKISSVELQEKPFERTPTQKIKRFLYPERRKKGDKDEKNV